MNVNNKYGQCCGCPAFMNDSRIFTIWEPNKLYHYKLSQYYNVSNDNALRYNLTNKPESLDKYNNAILSTTLCKNDNVLSFNNDGNTFHEIFNDMFDQYISRPEKVSFVIYNKGAAIDP